VAKKSKSLIAAGIILGLIGLIWSIGGVSCLAMGPQAMPGIVSDATVTKGLGALMLAVGVLLLIASGLTFAGKGWIFTIVASLIFIVDGFISNYFLFGSIRISHSGSNVVIMGLAIWLLWRDKSVR